MPQEVGRVRSAIRKAISNILSEIDSLVIRLFEAASRNEDGLLEYLKGT